MWWLFSCHDFFQSWELSPELWLHAAEQCGPVPLLFLKLGFPSVLIELADDISFRVDVTHDATSKPGDFLIFQTSMSVEPHFPLDSFPILPTHTPPEFY